LIGYRIGFNIDIQEFTQGYHGLQREKKRFIGLMKKKEIKLLEVGKANLCNLNPQVVSFSGLLSAEL
jgi:hypothetical protein